MEKEQMRVIIKAEVTAMFENILDFCHVACPPSTYPQLRSKVLRVGNNCIRHLISRLAKVEDTGETDE